VCSTDWLEHNVKLVVDSRAMVIELHQINELLHKAFSHSAQSYVSMLDRAQQEFTDGRMNKVIA
jgi:hypothetical protein